MSIMFKYGDDLRQDQLILQMINYMDSLLKKIHLDYEFTIYKTLATSKSDGFVEFVPNSKTIYDIIKTKQLLVNIEDFLKKVILYFLINIIPINLFLFIALIVIRV